MQAKWIKVDIHVDIDRWCPTHFSLSPNINTKACAFLFNVKILSIQSKTCLQIMLFSLSDNSESIIYCWLYKALSIYLHRNKTYATNIGKQLNSFQNRS